MNPARTGRLRQFRAPQHDMFARAIHNNNNEIRWYFFLARKLCALELAIGAQVKAFATAERKRLSSTDAS